MTMTVALAVTLQRSSISSFGEDVNGELNVADLGGAVLRLIDTAPPPPRRRAAGR